MSKITGSTLPEIPDTIYGRYVMFRSRFRSALLVLCVLLISISAHAQDSTRIRDVIYSKKAGVVLTMDVFKPANPNGIGVIWMVSGGWVSNHEGINEGLAKIFTSRGQTVFQVVHGAQPRFKVPEIVQDIHHAIRFIRVHAAEYGVDPNRLGISGGSAGGHLSLMIGTTGGPGKEGAPDPIDRASSAVQAVACFYPPTDFLNYGKDGQSAMEIATLKGYWPAFGVTDSMPKEQRDALAHSISPIDSVSSKTPPTLIIHGDADTLVPIQQSQKFIARLEENKIDCKLIVKPGKGHGWAGIEKDGEQLAEWFDKYLAKK
jgi:acetyl esterase/lipase